MIQEVNSVGYLIPSCQVVVYTRMGDCVQTLVEYISAAMEESKIVVTSMPVWR